MGNMWFTSDSHLMSTGTIIRENRPFKTSIAFDRYVIDLWNKQVEEDDVIYHLGDFTDYKDDVSQSWREGLKYVKYIKCDVVLVIGNNEQRIIDNVYDGSFDSFRNYCINIGFKDVVKDKILEIDDNTYYYLHHLPSKYKKGYINLFGHVHKAIGLYSDLGFNVFCDLNYFQLYSLDDINTLIGTKNDYWIKDKEVNYKI